LCVAIEEILLSRAERNIILQIKHIAAGNVAISATDSVQMFYFLF